MRTIESLQAARGIAALGVVICHAALAAHDFGAPLPGFRFAELGSLGVDFFFVLSGFIIYHSTVGRGRTLRDYAIARFRRVYLPYWPVGIAMALLYVVLPGLSAGNRDWSWLSTLTLAPTDVRPALIVAWTLQHEILFYLLFGLFYFSGLLWVGLGLWALGIIAGLPHLPFEPINLEFLFGIAACIAYRKGRAFPSLMLLAVPCVVLAYLTGERVFVGLMFAFLIAPISQLEASERFKVPPSLILLGAASYSLYLVHPPLISAVARIVPGTFGIFAAGIIVSLLGGLAYHFAVEFRTAKPRPNPEVALRLRPQENAVALKR